MSGWEEKMKKYGKFLVVILSCCLTVVGCGKKKQEVEFDDKKMDIVESELVDNTNVEDSNKEKIEDEQVECKEDNKLVVCERLPEWDEYTLADGAIQILDMIFYPCMPMEEAIKRVENSKFDLELGVDPDTEVGITTGVPMIMPILFEGEQIFSFSCWVPESFCNPDESYNATMPIKECYLEHAPMCADRKRCRFLGGYTIEELTEMGIEGIKDLDWKGFTIDETNPGLMCKFAVGLGEQLDEGVMKRSRNVGNMQVTYGFYYEINEHKKEDIGIAMVPVYGKLIYDYSDVYTVD